MASEGFAGEIAIDWSVGPVTVSVTAGDVIVPEVAVIPAVPAATPVARPALVTLATDGLLD